MQQPEWPGERNPSQWDVHDAYWKPEVSFLQRFKAALLSSQDAVGSRQYLDRESVSDNATWTATDLSVSNSMPQYTYPMVVLSDLPLLPDDEVLDRLHSVFLDTFKRHLLLNRITIPAPSSRNTPPYLRLALACLGRTFSTDRQLVVTGPSQVSSTPEQLASNLCLSAMRLWGVMMEIDNREARLVDSIIAGSFLTTYGMLTADSEFWDMALAALTGTATMARRCRLQYADLHPSIPDRLPLESPLNANSLLLSYLFLVDVVQAAHLATIPCLSSSELFIRMPSSPAHYFKPTYACLISGIGTLPADMKSEEDSLLLLTAICSDILYVHSTFSAITYTPNEAKYQSVKIRNPYVPLSAESEALHHTRDHDAALTRWHLHFGHVASVNVLSLFYFCRLVHALPTILCLPRMAGYAPAKHLGAKPLMDALAKLDSMIMTDEITNFAWLILDNIDARSERTKPNVSIWLPVVLFYAALTVWYQLQKKTSSSGLRTGTLRTLRMFRAELESLPWPCCIEMCLTLDRLMERQDES